MQSVARLGNERHQFGEDAVKVLLPLLNVIDAVWPPVNTLPFTLCRRPARRAGEAGNNRADLRPGWEPVDQRWNRFGRLPKFPRIITHCHVSVRDD